MEQTAANGTEQQQQQQPELKEVKFEYVDLLNQNNIKESDLPNEIKKKINALKPNYAKYQTTGNDSYYQAMVKLDYNIVQMIGDFIDQDLPDEEEYKRQEQDRIAREDAAAAEALDEANKGSNPPPKNTDNSANDDIDLEEKIIAKINSNGAKIITTSDLLLIVGKKYRDAVAEGEVKIHKTKLVKLFMRQEFRIG
jgi:hypothetical protein